jgi:DNA-binding transcriptional LysR family regulator
MTSADALARAVEDNEADVAISPRPGRWTGHTTVIGQEEIVVVLPSAHRLAESASVTFSQLTDEPIVHYHPDNGPEAGSTKSPHSSTAPSWPRCAPGAQRRQRP